MTPTQVAELRAFVLASEGPNHDVWDGEWCAAFGLSRDEAIGFAKGLIASGPTYIGKEYNPVVKLGGIVVWPEDRWGEGAPWLTEVGT